MTIPTTTKNAALDGLTVDTASLHTGFPGSTGANEVTGGTYAQLAVTFSTAGGVKTLSGGPFNFAVPACTVRWVGYWLGTTYRYATPNGGATPRNFVAIASNDTFYSASHGYSDSTKVVLYNGTPPGGLTEGTIYYVRDAATDSFKLAATDGGSAVALTSAASFGCVIAAITEDVYAAPGTHVLSSATVSIPD